MKRLGQFGQVLPDYAQEKLTPKETAREKEQDRLLAIHRALCDEEDAELDRLGDLLRAVREDCLTPRHVQNADLILRGLDIQNLEDVARDFLKKERTESFSSCGTF